MSGSVLEPLRQATDAAPASPAAFTSTGTVDYATLIDSVECAVGGFLEAGLGGGARVGLLMENSLTHLTFTYAIPGAGAVLVDIDPTWPVAEVEAVVHDAGLAGLVVDGGNLRLAEELQRRGLDLRMLDPDALAAGSPRAVGAEEDALAVISYGSTGRRARQARMLSHRDLLQAAGNAGARLAVESADRYLHLVPMASAADLILGLAGTRAGAAHGFGRDMTALALREAVEHDRITLVLVGPGMVGAIRRDPQTYGADLTSLRAVVSMDFDLATVHPILPDLDFVVHPLADATGASAAEVDLTTSDPLLTTASGHPD